MKRFLIYKVIPVLTLVIFIFIMHSETFLKKPLYSHDNVPKNLRLLQSDLQAGQWSTAGLHLKGIELAWRKVVPRIQFSVERDEINNFQHSLARLKGFLDAHQKAGALAEVEELKETWNDLGK